MLIIVLVANLLIGLTCLFVAWQVWQLRRSLAQVTQTLLYVEEAVHGVLYGAPGAILIAKQGTYQLRKNYRQLEGQLQRMQKVMGLLSLGQFLWQRRGVRFRRSRSLR
ncbi:hypothetical protein ACN4EK_32085 [Pantanalinema rosaneae CENA516]|uniref:hypothetical protein n=1 Tax=Pantanalinema rosaneae TaxID=1620701 RepID=UPI003D6F3831